MRTMLLRSIHLVAATQKGRWLKILGSPDIFSEKDRRFEELILALRELKCEV
jgi:hypothetical protein